MFQRDYRLVDVLATMCSCGGMKSVRIQNNICAMMFVRNLHALVMPVRVRKGRVQIMPIAEYFVHGSARRWVPLEEFISISDEPLFK